MVDRRTCRRDRHRAFAPFHHQWRHNLLPKSRGRRAECWTFDFGARPILQPNFTDLNGGLGVGVVGDIGKDRLRVRSECGLKGIGRVEIEMTHSDIGRWRPRRAAGDPFFDRHALAGRPELLLHHRHVPREIILHVELAARGVGIKYTHLDHVFSSTLMIANCENGVAELIPTERRVIANLAGRWGGWIDREAAPDGGHDATECP